MVADLISVEEAYGVDPATGQIDMDKFRRFAAQQEASLANMRANTQLSEPLKKLQANPELLNQATAYVASQGVAPGADFQAQVEDFAVQRLGQWAKWVLDGGLAKKKQFDLTKS